MTTSSEKYAELLALTQLYLFQNYAITDRLLATSSEYLYFREYALSKQRNAKPPENKTVKIPPKANPPSVPTAFIQPPSMPTKPLPNPVNIPLKTEKPLVAEKLALTLPSKEPQKLNVEPSTSANEPAPKNDFFTLAQAKPPSPLDLSDLRKIAIEKLPGLVLTNEIPNDEKARKRARVWEQASTQSDIVILTFDELNEHQTFLAKVGKALEPFDFSVQIIPAAKLSDADCQNLIHSTKLKLILANESGIKSFPKLIKELRQDPQQNHHFLGNNPVFLLSDISSYLNDSALKLSLWKAIKKLLSIS